ncbi:MAG: translation initiation factor IF-2 [bacterium]|nr:translation initiation factor IF-2 [bacterium]
MKGLSMEEGKLTVTELAKETKLSLADCIKVLARLGAAARAPEDTVEPQVREAAHKFVVEYRRRLRQKRAAEKAAKEKPRPPAEEAGKTAADAPPPDAPPARARPVKAPARSAPAAPPGEVVVRPGLGPLRPPGSTPRPERAPRPLGRPGAAGPPRPSGRPFPGKSPRPGGRVPRIPPAPAELAAEKPVRRRASATAPARVPGRPDRSERPERRLVHPRGRRGVAMETRARQEAEPVSIAGSLTVREFAELLGIKGAEAIRELMARGLMVTLNHTLEADTARQVAEELGYAVQEELDAEPKGALLAEPTEEEDPPESLQPRPPVVTVMGHVDHGKTSLLDAIRETHVAAGEAGGITQHIGASVVERGGRQVVFIDTPGHEAFTAMRARGARVTDIAVLVVAADDGVKPQTLEALNHARAAEVPIVVAINKMDLEGANPDRVRQQLSDHGLMPEEWGGQTVMVPVSAKTGEGLDTLLEMVLLVADMEDIRANPDRRAWGTVVEAELDRGRGPVATVLVQSGTLRVGDAFVVGRTHGRVRAMQDFRGDKLDEAPPSTPVQVLGLEEVPQAGDVLRVVDEDRIARDLALQRQLRIREKEVDGARRPALEDLFQHVREGRVKDLKLLIKADTQGSMEALRASLERLEAKAIRVSVVHGGVGAISESDVMLAAASNAVIIGFNVRPDANARAMASQENVDLRTYRIIYEVLNDIQAALEGLLEPEYREVVQGRVEIRAIFRIPKIGSVAGCYVTDGKITRQSRIRLLRDGTIIHEGRLGSLKHFKDDVREVQQGFECGLTLEGFTDYREGDVVEAYIMEQVT